MSNKMKLWRCFGVYPDYPEGGTWCGTVIAEDQDTAVQFAKEVMAFNLIVDRTGNTDEDAEQLASVIEDIAIVDVQEVSDLIRLLQSDLRLLDSQVAECDPLNLSLATE